MKTKAYAESLKPVSKHVRDLYGDQILSSSLVKKMLNKEDFEDFEAMTKKHRLFHPVNLSLFQMNKKVIFRKSTAILF